MNPGIYENVIADVYHALEAVSNSRLGWLNPPARYKARFIDRLIPDEDTPALRMGRIIHACVLEGDSVGKYHIKPEDMSFATKDGKAWRDAHRDKPILTSDEAKTIVGTVGSVWRHPVAVKALSDCKTEVTGIAEREGMLLKCRFDALPNGKKTIFDVKTTEDASERGFSRSIAKFGYHRQAAFYLMMAKLLGMERTQFAFIATEKEPPYLTAVYQIDQESVEVGRREILRDLALLKQCQESNEWPGYSLNAEVISLPDWMLNLE